MAVSNIKETPLVPALVKGWENLAKKPKNELINKLVDQIVKMDDKIGSLTEKNREALAVNTSKQQQERMIESRCSMALRSIQAALSGGIKITVGDANSLVNESMQPLDDFRAEQIDGKASSVSELISFGNFLLSKEYQSELGDVVPVAHVNAWKELNK